MKSCEAAHTFLGMRRFAARLILMLLALALLVPPSLHAFSGQHASLHGAARAEITHHLTFIDTLCLPDDAGHEHGHHDHAHHETHKAPQPLSAAQCALACASLLPTLLPPPRPVGQVMEVLNPKTGHWLAITGFLPPERPPRVSI